DLHAEDPAVPLGGTRHVGNIDHEMIERIHLDGHALSLCSGRERLCRTGRIGVCLLQRRPCSIQQKRTGSEPGAQGEIRMISRRTAICLTAIGLSAIATIGSAQAADYPSRPVRWVVGYPPGGATDIIA